RAYRWPRSALRTPRTLRLWPPGHACDGACECVRRGHGAPRERLYGSQAASLTSCEQYARRPVVPRARIREVRYQRRLLRRGTRKTRQSQSLETSARPGFILLSMYRQANQAGKPCSFLVDRDGHDAPPTVRYDHVPARLAPHNRAGRGAYREGVMELGSEDR